MSSAKGSLQAKAPTASTTATRHLVYAALLTALSIVATRLLSLRIPIGGVESVRIGFGPLPVLLSGIWLGPLWGGLVGLAADLVGFALQPVGAYLPQITLVSVLRGLLPALIIRLYKRTDLAGLSLAIAIPQILLSLVIMPLILLQAFGVPVIVNVPMRALTQLIAIPIYVTIARVLVRTGIFH